MGTSSSVFGIVQKQTGILWNGEGFFYKKKLSAILHFHNFMSIAKVTCQKIALKIMAKVN